MKPLLYMAALAFFAIFAAPHTVKADDMATDTAMHAKPTLILFYADTCGQCKILEPKLDGAMNELGADAVNKVTFDYSNRETIMASKDMAAENNLSDVQKKYGAKTGFAVLVNDSGEETGFIRASDSEEDILATLKSATQMGM